MNCPNCGQPLTQTHPNGDLPMLVSTDYDGDLETYAYGVIEFACPDGHTWWTQQD